MRKHWKSYLLMKIAAVCITQAVPSDWKKKQENYHSFGLVFDVGTHGCIIAPPFLWLQQLHDEALWLLPIASSSQTVFDCRRAVQLLLTSARDIPFFQSSAEISFHFKSTLSNAMVPFLSAGRFHEKIIKDNKEPEKCLFPYFSF